MSNPFDKREPGEALWPDRYPIEVLAKRKALSEREWAALYQGRPFSLKGEIFSRSRLGYWVPKEMYGQVQPVRVDDEEMPQPLIIIPPDDALGQMSLSLDASFKGRDDSDYIAMQVWVSSGSREFLIDQICGQKGFIDTLKALTSLLSKWPRISAVLIEDAANGPAIVDTIKASIPGVIELPTAGGKLARAHAVSPRFEAGDVYFPHPAIRHWINGLIIELVKFPRAKNDDQVDALTHYLAWRTKNKSGLDRLIAITQM